MRLLLLLLAALPAFAQHALEVIPLRHRTVDQVVPVLRPLLEPGGTLAGQASQLIVRTSPGNLAELRRALEAIDRPQRRLQILVRLEERAEAASRGVETSGRIGSRGARIDVRAQDERARAEDRIDQRIRVLEGGHAFIATGQSTAIPQQEAVVIRETATGFEAVPRLSGDTVFLDILQQRETPGGRFQRASTTVSARLGEWFEVGGAAGTATRDDRAILSGTQAQSSEARRIWIKVEEIRGEERR